MTRNYAEEDSVKKGLASLAVALGAAEGDVAQIDSQGNVTLAPSNGGSSPYENFAALSLHNFTIPWTAGSSGWSPSSAVDVLIDDQSGSDFSVDGFGQILSAGGGWFEAIPYFSIPQGVTLDAGHTFADLPMLTLAFVMGDGGDAHSYGYDSMVPCLPVSWWSSAAFTGPSGPGKCAPGGTALSGLSMNALGLTGTDSIAHPEQAISSGIYLFQVG